jgi:hypothetical protein
MFIYLGPPFLTLKPIPKKQKKKRKALLFFCPEFKGKNQNQNAEILPLAFHN